MRKSHQRFRVNNPPNVDDGPNLRMKKGRTKKKKKTESKVIFTVYSDEGVNIDHISDALERAVYERINQMKWSRILKNGLPTGIIQIGSGNIRVAVEYIL